MIAQITNWFREFKDEFQGASQWPPSIHGELEDIVNEAKYLAAKHQQSGLDTCHGRKN